MKLPLCMGFPVRFDPKARFICKSLGIGRWREIVVGPNWTAFPPAERAAMLVHEVGHLQQRHLEQRLRRLLTFRWRNLLAFCAMQEFEADRFAAQRGYGPALAAALSRMRDVSTTFHPPVAVRVGRLRQMI